MRRKKKKQSDRIEMQELRFDHTELGDGQTVGQWRHFDLITGHKVHFGRTALHLKVQQIDRINVQSSQQIVRHRIFRL